MSVFACRLMLYYTISIYAISGLLCCVQKEIDVANRQPIAKLESGPVDTPQEDLATAAREGNLPALERAIAGGADPRLPNQSGRTPLHLAIASGSLPCIRALIDAGADVNFHSERCQPPLIVAAYSEQTEICELLIRHGANVNLWDSFRFQPIHYASSKKNSKLIKLLLASGARVNDANNEERSSALHLAVAAADAGSRLKSIDCVSILIAAGAEVDLLDSDHRTPLMIAATTDNMPIVAELLSRHVDLSLVDTAGRSVVHYAVMGRASDPSILEMLAKYGADMKARDVNGCSPLLLACRYGKTSFVSFLLDANASDIEASADAGELAGLTPLLCAAVWSEPVVITALLKNGAKPDVTDHDGNTPLLRSLHSDQIDNAMAILNGGVAPTVGDPGAENAIKMICEGSSDAAGCLRYIIEHGGVVQANDSSRDNALLLACGVLNVECVRYLSCKTNVAVRNERHETAIAVTIRALNVPLLLGVVSREAKSAPNQATSRGDESKPLMTPDVYASLQTNESKILAIMQILVDAGCDKDGVDDDGCAAVHVAAGMSTVRVIRKLLEIGCVVSQSDNAGKLPLAYAERRSDREGLEIAKILRSRH